MVREPTRTLRSQGASNFRRAASGAGAVLAIGMLVAALIFSNSIAARRVAEDARVLQRAEVTLGASSLAVKAMSQAVLLAEDLALGVADESTAVEARAEARATLEDLSQSSHVLSIELGTDEEYVAAAQAAITAGAGVIELLEEGRVEEAGVLLGSDGKNAFEGLRDVAAVHRDEASAAVTSTSSLVYGIGSLPAFLVAFVIPVAAILAYQRVARRQLRIAEIQLDARLESERHLVRAKDEFVANVSHELRTPLTSIYGFSELLLEQGLVDPESSLELLAMINSESAELQRMVEDLLTSARHEAGTITLNPSLVDIPALMETEIERLPAAGKLIQSDFTITTAWADGERVRHIVRNLLSNAQRYGGSTVRVVAREQGDHATIVVADDGAGVDPGKEARLFTRYVHDGADPLLVGSIGLGLSIVRILAEAMGGDASYERVDGWSRFAVRLPLQDLAATGSRLPATRSGTLPPHVAAARPTAGPVESDARPEETAVEAL